MIYPTQDDYIRAVEELEENFTGGRSLQLELRADGLPMMSSGNFAMVFKVKDQDSGEYKALKCFTRDQDRRDDSYRKISEELEFNGSSYLVRFEYFADQLYVYSDSSDNEYWPCVLMDWVDGMTLDKYLMEYRKDQQILSKLTYQFCRMASWLLSQNMAHGDLKPDNILVRPDGSMVLVDYDGMFVPSMRGEKAREGGTRGYVHYKEIPFDEHIDDFAIAMIALSLKTLSLNPDAYTPSDTLLFDDSDYRDLYNSDKFGKLKPFV